MSWSSCSPLHYPLVRVAKTGHDREGLGGILRVADPVRTRRAQKVLHQRGSRFARGIVGSGSVRRPGVWNASKTRTTSSCGQTCTGRWTSLSCFAERRRGTGPWRSTVETRGWWARNGPKWSRCARPIRALPAAASGATPSRRSRRIRRCSRCKRIAYCGRACQTLDWAEHRKECCELTTTCRLPNVSVCPLDRGLLAALQL
jgi:MYND finger